MFPTYSKISKSNEIEQKIHVRAVGGHQYNDSQKSDVLSGNKLPVKRPLKANKVNFADDQIG